jgi:2'-5' RNA ligase
MMEGMAGHYLLWLLPSGAAERRIAGWIDRLSRDPGGPRFDPHLTLLGGLEGAEVRFAAATWRLAAALRPITLRFLGAESGDSRYRCLYLRVDGGGALASARREAIRLFGRAREAAFQPHVSLLYGDLPREARDRAAAAVGDWRGVACRAGRLRLVAAGGGPPTWRTICEHVLGAGRRGRGPASSAFRDC